MIDTECVRFLQWALPQLHMRWPGAAIRGIENCTSPISTFWREAERRNLQLHIAGNGQKLTVVCYDEDDRPITQSSPSVALAMTGKSTGEL